MVNRLVVSFLVILMLLGVAIYFRVEFKYGMVAKNHSQLLADELKVTKSLEKEEARLDAIVKIAEKHGIAFADDFKIIDQHLFSSCESKCLNMIEYYDSLDKIVSLIERKKMWVVRKNRTKDSVAYYIQSNEEKQIAENLLKRRITLSDHYASLSNFDLREKSLRTLSLLDEKIKVLRTPAQKNVIRDEKNKTGE